MPNDAHELLMASRSFPCIRRQANRIKILSIFCRLIPMWNLLFHHLNPLGI